MKVWPGYAECLASKAVQGASLTLQGVHNIKCCDGLPTGVLSVGDSIPDHILQEHLEHTPGLLIDEARDTLDTSTTSQTPDGGLGDACKQQQNQDGKIMAPAVRTVKGRTEPSHSQLSFLWKVK